MSGEPIVRSSFHSVAKSHIAPVLLAAPVIALPVGREGDDVQHGAGAG